MTDKELLDWIEDEMRQNIGMGDLWHIMHELHVDFTQEITLKEAIERRLETPTPNNPNSQPGGVEPGISR